MVQIIVNEDENNNEKVISKLEEIQKNINSIGDIDGRFEDMRRNVEDMVVSVTNQHLELMKAVEGLYKQHSTLLERFDELKELTEPKIVNATNKSTEVVKKQLGELTQSAQGTDKRKSVVRKNNNERFEPADYSKGIWAKLKLLDNGQIVDKTRSRYVLPVDVYDLLYVIECDENGLTHGEFKELYKQFNSNNNTIGKLIYNIRENSFDKIVKKYYNSIKKVKFEIYDGYLRVNGEKTTISVSKAREWVDLMFNSNRKQSKILEIVNANPSIGKNLIHVICDNYNNSELLSLIKEPEKEPFIENNPSRRKNLIMNGGVL